MRRKVIQIANSTQLVSLPRKWTLKYGVKKGDELEIEEDKNNLKISVPSKNEGEKELELTINDSSKFLRRLLFSPYIQGYTQIKVNYKDRKIFDLISNELELLMGYEIINQEHDHCIIKRIATAMDDDFDNILDRIFISTKSMINELIDALKEEDMDKLNHLVALELTNNKLSYFCLRVLNTKGYKDQIKTNSLYYIILLIEQIVDDLRDICLYIPKNKIKVEKPTIELMEKNLYYFEFVYRLFKNFNNNLLVDFNKGIKDLTTDINKRISKGSKDAITLSYLHKIADNISHISKEIHY
jgi:phosphate uptake regulator